MKLTAAEARVLGALVEKETTTPEYYPLSLNALVNACNQKNNREPVTHLTEEDVRQALHGLQNQELAAVARASEGRVTKYEHRLQEVFNFTRGETAVICVLLLRGAQTPGELRGRAERIYGFAELEDVVAVLQRLMQREPPLTAALPRQPGTKEIRYVELLSGTVESRVSEHREDVGQPAAATPASEERLKQIEAEVAQLHEEVAQMRSELTEMRVQTMGGSGA